MFFEFVGGTNTREHEDLWATEGAAADDNLFVSFEGLA